MGRPIDQVRVEGERKIRFPVAIEEEIKLLPWVEKAMVYGDGRPFNVCIIVPDFVVLGNYAREHQLPDDPAQLVSDQTVRTMIADEITTFLNGKFGKYEISKKFLWLAENFSLENGALNQTMKLKHRCVLEQYQSQLEAMYR